MNREKLLLTSISLGIFTALLSVALIFYLPSIALPLLWATVTGVVVGTCCGWLLTLEVARRRGGEPMSRLQVALLAIVVGVVAGFFAYAIVEPDSRLMAAIIGGPGIAIVFYMLILQDQRGGAGKKVEYLKQEHEMKEIRKRRKFEDSDVMQIIKDKEEYKDRRRTNRKTQPNEEYNKVGVVVAIVVGPVVVIIIGLARIMGIL